MNKEKKKKQLKKFLKFYYEGESVIELTSSFMLILAFVIVLPSLVEIQMGFIAAICTLAIGIKMTFNRLKKAFPTLEKETRKEYTFYEKFDELNDEIKVIKRRLKEIGKESKK